MHSRWANFAVVVLWLATMTWLVTEKVLPPLLTGEPPSGKTVLAARQQQPVVGWQIRWNEETIGWALSRTRRLPDATTEIRSHVHFARLPLGELTPGWLRAVFTTLAKAPPDIQADARSELLLGATGRLVRVESVVRFEPFGEEVSMEGIVEGSKMQLVLHSHELIDYRTTIIIDPDALHGEALSPQTQLPGLRDGQTWTVEVCNPLRYPNSPVEVLQATVVGLQPVLWHDTMVQAWLVEYHDNPGARLSGDSPARGRLWVRPDGTVLVQEVSVFSSDMRFVRMNQEQADELAGEHGLAATGQ